MDYSIHYGHYHPASREHHDMMAHAIARQLEPHVPKEMNLPVLDVGCGFGFGLGALGRLGFTNRKGIEISKEQAAVARSHGHDVEVVSHVEQWLDARPGMYHFVLLMDVLEHVPRECQEAFLCALHASLDARGTVYITVPNACAPLAMFWLCNDITHRWSYTQHSLRCLLLNAGFSEINFCHAARTPRFPMRVWRKGYVIRLRRWFARWVWEQNFYSEFEKCIVEEMSLNLNIYATAVK